jgi:hypothetical protein
VKRKGGVTAERRHGASIAVAVLSLGRTAEGKQENVCSEVCLPDSETNVVTPCRKCHQILYRFGSRLPNEIAFAFHRGQDSRVLGRAGTESVV